MILQQLQRDLSFTFPPSYLSMHSSGLFNHDSDNCLLLSDTEWLDPGEIARESTPQLIPFAQSGRGDQWAFLRSADQSSIAFAPHDARATFYGPSFQAAIYRLLLEEFSSSWLADSLDDPAQLLPLFQRYALNLQPHLPKPWAATLLELTHRPLQSPEPEIFGVLTPHEATALLRRDVNFSQLDQPL